MKVQKILTIAACAAFITSASASVTMDWVTVGNAGNAAQSASNRTHDESAGDGYGSVGYEYKIGKYEVTNAQYGAFLNAKAVTDSNELYHTSMSTYGITRSGSSGSFTYSVTGALANRPVVYVSWFDAARFANWLANGQGSGDTETGSYTLNGATSGIILANAGAQVYIPTEDEWYKAAYYNGANQTYSLYPNGQDIITTADANYGSNSRSTTDVGTYSNAPSSYGTFDQGGNVREWNDRAIDTAIYWTTAGIRGIRGGSYGGDSYYQKSSNPDGSYSGREYDFVGFRVAAVPEPSAMVLTMLASGMMLIRRKR
jgi:formylglycine-generating enzyme required for sulfatase activity